MRIQETQLWGSESEYHARREDEEMRTGRYEEGGSGDGVEVDDYDPLYDFYVLERNVGESENAPILRCSLERPNSYVSCTVFDGG
jgi:hypothetical protein